MCKAWDEGSMVAAIKAVQEGCTVSKAARDHVMMSQKLLFMIGSAAG